jgi:hypothetical protein
VSLLSFFFGFRKSGEGESAWGKGKGGLSELPVRGRNADGEVRKS